MSARRAPVRQPRSLRDRPGRLKLMLRRQRKLLRPMAFLCAGLLVVGGGYRLSQGRPDGVLHALGGAASMTGMVVRTISVEGRANTPEPLLAAAIGVRPGDAIMDVPVSDVRARVERLSWIEGATVIRRLPDTIVVRVAERRPFAIWQNDRKFQLVDRDGAVVEDQDLSAFKSLPLVVGAGAPAAAAALLDALRDRPVIAERVAASVRVSQRRWNLRLTQGGDVLLPEGAEVAALDRLSRMQQSMQLLDRPLAAIDLRLPDRMTVRPIATDPKAADLKAADPKAADPRATDQRTPEQKSPDQKHPA